MTINAVKLDAYPSCCGMFVLTNFFSNPYLVNLKEPKNGACCSKVCAACKLNHTNAVKNTDGDEEGYKRRIQTQVSEFLTLYKKKKAYFLATLNDVESSILEKTLLDLGFTILIGRTRNPTGTFITTYIYDLQKIETKKPGEKVESILKKMRV